jgi:phosphatidylglycerophosphate synthase
MSKLKKEDRFFDISDYGRPFAKAMANALHKTKFTPIHATLLFGIAGVGAVICILTNHFFAVAILLVIKSILDALDGELARVKNTPSYIGRYLDSIFDIILNFFILFSVGYISHTNPIFTFIAFLSIQMQGTLYNYYYVILRNKLQGGDTTSKIFEYKEPIAYSTESQKTVHVMYTIFNILYSFFDKTIHLLDTSAYKTKNLPNWFMSIVSIYGLGFQLLIIGIMLIVQLQNIIIPFFIIYNVFIFIFIAIRKIKLS